eukprot:COSAG01_NODE_8147_length_2904_cov_1.658111_7_plen_40_part_01
MASLAGTPPPCLIRMWVGIMGPDTHENVGQSQSVLIMINP